MVEILAAPGPVGPRVFVSYAWETDEYRLLVKRLSVRLRADGVDARLDAWDARGVSIPEFMNREVRHAERVLIVCSPAYRQNVHAMEDGLRVSGVGWEGMLVTSSLFFGALSRDRLSVVLLRGSWEESAPDFLRSLPFTDLSDDATFEANYQALLRECTGRSERAPPLGNFPPGIELDLVEPLRGSLTTSGFIVRTPSLKRDELPALPLESPGVVRHLLDRAVPSLHNALRRFGRGRTPPEHADITAYLKEVRASLEHEISKKTYVANFARPVPSVPHAEDEGPDPFVRPIHQVIREILGRSEGGDSASAQLAAVNRKSRVVRNLIRTLLTTDDPLMLLGDPGTGKTMTLQRAALELVNAELKRVFPTVCIYVRLGEFHIEGRVTAEHVLDYIECLVPAPIRSRLAALDEARRLIILFDGLDEMSREGYTAHTEALSKYAGARRGSTKTLFSCRVTDFSPSFRHLRLVLLPFNRRQILSYLRQYFNGRPVEIEGERWELRRLARHIARGEFAVDARNPFVLWLLCFHLAKKHSWPSSRMSLLRFHVEETYRRKQADAGGELAFPPHEDALGHWTEFAYCITERNKGSAMSVDELALMSNEPSRVHSMVRLGSRCGVLAESKERHSYQVRFDHHRLQEYFTALYVHEKKPVVSWLDKLDAPRWQETTVNLVLLGGGEDAVSALAESIDKKVGPAMNAWRAYEQASDAYNRGNRKDRPRVPNLSEDDEILLADRFELAARIAREASGTEAVRTRLLPALRSAADFLTLRGNPITQVKVIRACVHVSDPTLIETARRPKKSEVSWVRDQALILLSAEGRGLGANLATEIGYALAGGVLIARLPAYARAVAASPQPGARSSLFVGVLSALSFPALLVPASAGVYLGALELISLAQVGFWTEVGARLSAPAGLVLVAAVSATLSLLTFFRAPALLWMTLLGAPLACLVLAMFLGGLWSGTWIPLLVFLAVPLAIFGLMIEMFVVVTLALVPGVLGYAVLTGKRRSELSVRAMVEHAWESLSVPTGLVPSAVIHGIALTGYLAYRFEVVALIVTVILGLVVVVMYAAIAVQGVKLLRKYLRERKDGPRDSRMPRELLRMSGIAVPVLGMLVLLNRFAGLYVARILFVFCAVGLAGLCIWYAFGWLRWLASAMRRRPFPRGTFSAVEWTEALKKAKPLDQEDLVFRTRHESLNLTPQEYARVLANVAEFVKEEPALSTYWEHRAELEQILKQERQG